MMAEIHTRAGTRGNDDHVKSGEKARFCRCGSGDADLLGGGCDEQEESAEESSGDQDPPVSGSGLGRGRFPLHYRYEGKQGDPGQPATAGKEGEGTHIVCSHTLGDECRAPDHGGEKQKKGADDFLGPCVLHDLPPKATSS